MEATRGGGVGGRVQRVFPVGLYGLLLGALSWLAVPQLSAPVERALLGAVGLSAWWHAELVGAPAAAAELPTDAQAVARLGAALQQRLRSSAVTGARALMPVASAPVLGRVLAHRRSGGGGQPAEVLLDRTYRELAGCGALVTRGEVLVGLLCRPGLGPAEADVPSDAARVLLLNHPAAGRWPATMTTSEPGPGLRFLVEAAASVDPAPLRTTLWDDPYRASRLTGSGQEVRTLATEGDGGMAVPGGLLLGVAKVWGYQRGGETLSIGVFVEPALDYRSLSHVVLWSAAGAEPIAPPPPRSIAATAWPVPGGIRGRVLVRAGETVPDGAAVVRAGICLGTATGLQFGLGAVTPFAASRSRWSLLLLPDAADVPPQELLGEVVGGAGTEAWVRCHPPGAVTAGFLFTGSNGPHCPAGLLLGRIEPQPEPGLVRVLVAAADHAGPVTVVRGTP